MNRQSQISTPKGQDTSSKIPKVPDRPLPPYLKFSRKTWPKVRSENPDCQLWEVSRMIGQLWDIYPECEKTVFQQEFEIEKLEYEKAMKSYQQSYSQYLSIRSRNVKNAAEKGIAGNVSRKSGASDQNTISGVIIQPVDDEDPYEMTSKRLSAIRYDRNNRLMTELFSTSYLPDQRSMVPQHRIEQLRRQGLSLEQHQNKLNDELLRLEDSFNQRKRAIELSTDVFNKALKKVCEDRPNFNQEGYEARVSEWQSQLLKNYGEYKRRLQAKIETGRKETPVLSSLINGSNLEEIAPEDNSDLTINPFSEHS